LSPRGLARSMRAHVHVENRQRSCACSILRTRSTPGARLITDGRTWRLSNGNGPILSSCPTGRARARSISSSCPMAELAHAENRQLAFAVAPFLAGTLNAGCVPDCCMWRLSRAVLWQPEWGFWLLVFGSNGNSPTSSSCPMGRTSSTVRTGSIFCDRSVSRGRA